MESVTHIRPAGGLLDFDGKVIWNRRELLYFLVWRDVKVRYKHTLIGVAWVVLQPLATMIVFTLFFGWLARLSSDGLPYPVFYFSGLVPWLFFAAAVQGATNAIVDNERLVTKVYFPRIYLPFTRVLGSVLDLGISCTVLLAMILSYGIPISWQILCAPLFLALAGVTVSGASLWLSAMNALYRDVRFLVPFLIQLGMFASPVVYPASLVPDQWRWLYGLNPMAGAIEGFRWSLTGKGQPPDLMLSASVGVAFLLFVSGLLFFQRTEGKLADVV